MVAALATLLFGATLWLVGLLALRIFEESGAKVLAAVQGLPPAATSSPGQPAVRVSFRGQVQPRAKHSELPRLRAAA